MSLNKFFFIQVFSFLFFINVSAIVKTALGASPIWNMAASWSPSGVPSCGDEIIIPAGCNITINSNINLDETSIPICSLPTFIFVAGNIGFSNNANVRLACGSGLYILPGGTFGTSGIGNESKLYICNTQSWNTSTNPPVAGLAILGSAPLTLPIELVSFHAVVNSNNIDLVWVTGSEKNNSKFEVERSNNAIDFSTIASHYSKEKDGNSSIHLYYKLTDPSPLSNTSYYRLKQIDSDLTVSYSSVISVLFIPEINLKFILYPNPNSGEFTVDFSGFENNHNIKVVLHKQNGELVYESDFYLQEAQQTSIQIIPVNTLSVGLYICSLIIEDISFKIKVLVQ